MSDLQYPAENRSGPSPATFKASGEGSEPDVPLQLGTFQADVEGLESFEDEPGHTPALPTQQTAPSPPRSSLKKPRPVKAPAAKVLSGKAVAAKASDKPHSRSLSVFWPTLLIAAGAVLLLTNVGYLPKISWSRLWRFWPVLLIAMGLDTLFSRRSMFGSIIGALLILALLGGVIYVVAFTP